MTLPRWPELRDELDLMPGPTLSDGQPSWTLHDPSRNLFFRIDWPTFSILKNWSYADPAAIAQRVSESTTLQVSAQDVMAVLEFMSANQLLRADMVGQSAKMADMLRRRRGGWGQWLLHHYLFIRIPLIRPDAWLGRAQRWTHFFYNPSFFWLSGLVLLLGWVGIGRQWDRFSTSLIDSFNFWGVVSYAVALVGVKVLHELGHALTAKRFGCRVPTMGVALVVMWPMAYTDTNEVWRLSDHKQRLAVASAGIVTEGLVAAWSTLAWVLLPDGALRDGAFVLATTSWIATLVVNASPFMRFDGYYILSDWLDMPNLHERCFALARWSLREWLFDLQEPQPEHPGLSRQRAMIVFAWVTWVYRLVVFLGIAVLVYAYFFKALGLFLFLVEIAWFVWMPLRMELKAWVERKDAIRAKGRGRLSLGLALALVLAACMPWPGRVDASALLRPSEFWTVLAPDGARLDQWPHANGAALAKGEVMLHMTVPYLASRAWVAQAKLHQAQDSAVAALFDPEQRQKLAVHQDRVATAEAQRVSAEVEFERFSPTAPFSGVWFQSDPDLQAGQWLSKREPLGVLIADTATRWVETWLEEDGIQRLSVGATATYIDDAGIGPVLKLRVVSIDRDASPQLPKGELAVMAGGHLMVREQNRQWIPERAIYRVLLAPEPGPAQELPWLQVMSGSGHLLHSQRGRVLIEAKAESPLWPYVRRMLSVVIREFGS